MYSPLSVVFKWRTYRNRVETDVSTLTGDFSSDGNYGVCHTPDTVLQRDTHSQDETRKLLEENNSIDNGDVPLPIHTDL
jgi:hypothetical protein